MANSRETRQQLLSAARDARKMLEKYALKSNIYFPHLGGLCYKASLVLMKRLLVMNFKPKLLTSMAHWFVVCDGFIIDITASQFGQPPVIVINHEYIKRVIDERTRDLHWWSASYELSSQEVMKHISENEEFISALYSEHTNKEQ